MDKPEYIIIHHSATKEDTFANDWESIRKYHKSQGWRDIGYHYGIEYVNGKIVTQKGREESETGAHCQADRMNHKSIGICLVGNYEVQKPTEEQMQALENLCRDIMKRYNIPASKVLGHREVPGAATACPGKNVDMNAFRKRLEVKKMNKKDYEGHYFQNDIEAVKKLGIMSGKDDNTFEPDRPVARGELAAAFNRFYRMLKKEG